MTAAKKTSWTLAGVVASAALVFGLWPQIQPVLDWLSPILGRDQVQAVLTGWAVAAFTLPLPWVVPKRWHPALTKSTAAAIAFVTAASVALALTGITRTAVVYAIGMAGMGSIVVNSIVVGAWLLFKPTPESLQP